MAIIVNAILLYVLVSIFGNSSDPSSRWKVFIVAVLVAIGEGAAATALRVWWWAIVLLVASAAIVAVALELWCKLPRATAIKIAAIFMAVRIALAAALLLVLSRH